MSDRYSRQVILPEIGESGQARLGGSHVAIIGCGALGTVAADNLARAGVGHLILIDRDVVELNNLQRQTLFSEEDVGRPKAIAAAERLGKVNSAIKVEPAIKDINHTNVEEVVRSVDLVLDGTDNFHTRLVVNDACVKHGIPWIYAAAVGTSGLVMPVLPEGPCLRCLFPDPPSAGALPTCDTAGVLNTATTIIASMESTEAIKVLLRKDVRWELLTYDAWAHRLTALTVKKGDECPCCGRRDFRFLNAEEREIITSLCGRNAVQITPVKSGRISFAKLAERLRRVGEVNYNEFILTFRTQGKEISVFQDGRVIVKGTTDEMTARSLYARYVGT
jgi:adenylyltransferase/sulfurtransferase